MPPPDWNQRYATGQTPWDVGVPSPQLATIIRDHPVPRGKALELGCGTGTNAIFMAQQGFEMTGLDLSPLAIEKAREKAAAAGASVRFLQADVLQLPELGQFPFVFDRGVFHCVRRISAFGFMKALDRVLAPGGWYYTEAGNANEQRPPEQEGPPQLTQAEIAAELSPLLRLVDLREFHFEGIQIGGQIFRPLAWSALFQRR